MDLFRPGIFVMALVAGGWMSSRLLLRSLIESFHGAGGRRMDEFTALLRSLFGSFQARDVRHGAVAGGFCHGFADVDGGQVGLLVARVLLPSMPAGFVAGLVVAVGDVPVAADVEGGVGLCRGRRGRRYCGRSYWSRGGRRSRSRRRAGRSSSSSRCSQPSDFSAVPGQALNVIPGRMAA